LHDKRLFSGMLFYSNECDGILTCEKGGIFDRNFTGDAGVEQLSCVAAAVELMLESA